VSSGKRICSFDGLHEIETAIIDRAALTEMVSGPAIIEDAWSTVVVLPGWQARPDDAGNLFLTRRTA
jgi:N-methylhydantoinase A